MNREDFISETVELNVFYTRIFKEHCIFNVIGLPPPAYRYAQSFDRYKIHFEVLLGEFLDYTSLMQDAAGTSGALLTQRTLACESRVQELYGVSVNHRITVQEGERIARPPVISAGKLPLVYEQVGRLQQKGKELATGLVSLTKAMQSATSAGKLAAAFFPGEAEHQILEAEEYMSGIAALERGDGTESDRTASIAFWVDRHREHAMVIRGDLDPSESALIAQADDFARRFAAVIAGTEDAATVTGAFSEFASVLTEGQLDAHTASRMPVLQTDHIKREADYLLRLIKR